MKNYKFFFCLYLIFSTSTYGDNLDKCDVEYRQCIKPSETIYAYAVRDRGDFKKIQRYILKTRKTSGNKLKLDQIKICLINKSYYVIFKDEKIELTKICIEILEKCSKEQL